MRPISSYHKVRLLISAFLRGRKFQKLTGRTTKNLKLLQVGCGPCANSVFVNLDYFWQPGVDIVWDINQKLPFASGRFEGIFTEHCLEHFDLKNLDRILKELFRVLSPHGILRIVVPDLKKYAMAYTKRIEGKQAPEGLATAKDFNRVFYVGHEGMVKNKWINNGHHYIHDFESMEAALLAVGFKKVTRYDYGEGEKKELLIDRKDRAWESLYVEASK